MMKMNLLSPYLINIIMFMMIMIIIMNYLHPIMFLLLLLFYTISLSLLMSMWTFNFMFSIFMFLIMISGILIIFMYFSSLISNDYNKIYPPTYLKILNSYIITMMFMLNMKNYNNFYFKYYFTENKPLINMNINLFNNIFKIYAYPFNNMTFLSMLYLLLSMIMIIKMCSTKFTSMRKIL